MRRRRRPRTSSPTGRRKRGRRWGYSRLRKKGPRSSRPEYSLPGINQHPQRFPIGGLPAVWWSREPRSRFLSIDTHGSSKLSNLDPLSQLSSNILSAGSDVWCAKRAVELHGQRTGIGGMYGYLAIRHSAAAVGRGLAAPGGLCLPARHSQHFALAAERCRHIAAKMRALGPNGNNRTASSARSACG
jgi:hypothetical protein